MVVIVYFFVSWIVVEILKDGGSVIDGVIVVNVVFGLMEFIGCGIGGDFFVIVWDLFEKKFYGLNVFGCSFFG